MTRRCATPISAATSPSLIVVKAVVEVSEEELAERTRKGLDVFDEMWNGVLRMNPPPTTDHQGFGGRLFVVCSPLAERRGLVAFYGTGLYRPVIENDWRVPDQIYCSPQLVKHRGVEGPAELVVEFNSPHDESYQKLGFYGEQGVGEVLITDPITRRFDLFVNRDGQMVLVQPEKSAHVAALDARLTRLEDRLCIEGDGVSTDV